ncbi:tRNA1(Val) (adenine(37)-N6)-methyltransferase [Pseudobutyrivibrio xylanivorans]|uniref:tRNA1(Val) (Adenine(37)-N6)-methyltransferase n=1 Tax=Pseudobutyrivibrio xylanivorans TaxID=185007 RepID=A0A5P6VR46_PSEXY|nr:tRNA1(Val) (adenine(37)-N6)-methyltransferase [Pseudobutyrivibrio xylanivorans]QFJ54159.1 tRNA1(Val) (adenine(37)-N6)-methyltransferase [Pseudobutyrivibrio xylanivorans]
MENLVRSDERLDDLQINGYKIIQHPDKFCFGMDAVLLSDFAKVKPGETVLDMGTGTGILPILLEAKTEGSHFTGLEIQPESAEMANRSVLFNGLQDKIDIIEGDIKSASEFFGKGSMNVVTSNPPYMTNHHGLKNPNDAKAIARHELLCSLEDVISQTAAVLKPKGRCYFVHRPFRLVEIITLMKQYKLEPKRMRLVYPFVDKEPNMVLIEGVKGGGAQLTVEAPLIVYDAPGQYTEEIYKIYGMIMEK